MKISKKLPQFKNSKVLLVVISMHDAYFYLSYEGEIQEVESFHIDNPEYSDREGFFMSSRGGEMMGSGAVYEAKKNKVKTDFISVFRKRLKRIMWEREVEVIYLFAPEMFLKRVEESLPSEIRRKIKGVIKGNYIKQHLFELLKKVD